MLSWNGVLRAVEPFPLCSLFSRNRRYIVPSVNPVLIKRAMVGMKYALCAREFWPARNGMLQKYVCWTLLVISRFTRDLLFKIFKNI
jgi:hypothetical protein